jgi:predicted nucleic acid-binding protein
MPIVAVVADANVLLSAIVGKAALRVFTDFAVTVHATRFNADEVEEYLPRLSSKYKLPEALVLLQWRLLAVSLHPEGAYVEHLAESCGRLAERDPDDAHPLALAMKLALPLWSNDRDLDGHEVPAYTTARLLRILEQAGN